MVDKVYLAFSKNRHGCIDFEAFGNPRDAVRRAKAMAESLCELPKATRELDVTDFEYYAVNIIEGIEVWVESRKIVFATSSVSTSSFLGTGMIGG